MWILFASFSFPIAEPNNNAKEVIEEAPKGNLYLQIVHCWWEKILLNLVYSCLLLVPLKSDKTGVYWSYLLNTPKKLS